MLCVDSAWDSMVRIDCQWLFRLSSVYDLLYHVSDIIGNTGDWTCMSSMLSATEPMAFPLYNSLNWFRQHSRQSWTCCEWKWGVCVCVCKMCSLSSHAPPFLTVFGLLFIPDQLSRDCVEVSNLSFKPDSISGLKMKFDTSLQSLNCQFRWNGNLEIAQRPWMMYLNNGRERSFSGGHNSRRQLCYEYWTFHGTSTCTS